MKKILVTNDDGFESAGLRALIGALQVFGEVICVAPAREKSACGHGLTITEPLRLTEISKNFYKLDDGGPTDCVYLAMGEIFRDSRPDLVVSGINLGSNLSEDVTYSGTVAGAIEGAIYGVPSVAISQVLAKNSKNSVDFSLAVATIQDLAEKIFKNGFPLQGRKILNVNIPKIAKNGSKGYKISQMGHRIYVPRVHLHTDPRGFHYHFIGKQDFAFKERDCSLSSDFAAVNAGYVSITPLTVNLTSYEDFGNLEEWIS